MSYTKYGPFTDNNPPGISSSFLNGVENFLVICVGDGSITSDGNGNQSLTSSTGNKFNLSGSGAQFTLLAGSLSRVGFFTGSGSTTATHGLNATPTAIFLCYAGNFGTAPTQAIAWYGATTTQVNVVAQSGYSWTGVAFHS